MWQIIIRPPGTVVPDGLLFHRRCFFFLGSHISEVPQPIAAKLCHMIGIWLKRSRKLQKFLGRSPQKILGAKNVQKFGRFFAPSDFDCEYLRNGLRYPNQKGTFSISIPSAFYETDPVNFGPRIPEIGCEIGPTKMHFWVILYLGPQGVLRPEIFTRARD